MNFAPETPHRRNWALALLFCAGALNLFDRQIINILAQSITVLLKISDAQLGLLTGTAFGLFYAALGIPLGRIADRVDRVRLMAVILVIWSGFTALCGFAGSFTQLFFARMGVGVGEAGSQPASTALVSDLFPIERRTSAMSLLLAGAPVGGLLGLMVGGYVGSVWGWRAAFVVAGVPGIVLAAIIAITMGDPRPRHTGFASSQSLLNTLRLLLGDRRYVWLTIALICVTFAPYAAGAWLPPFFIRVYGMSSAEHGKFAGLAVGLGGVFGTLGSGLLCDALRARVAQVEFKVLMTALGLGLVSLSLTLFVAQRSAALFWMFPFYFCAYAFLGPIVTLIQRDIAADSRGLAIAVCVTVANIFNLGLALPVVGLISDALKAAYGPRSIGVALEMGAVFVGIIGMSSFWNAGRSRR